eukprot:403340631
MPVQILVFILSNLCVVNSTCLKYAFPHTLGGLNDATKIYGMDVLYDDIVIGGIVHDSSIAQYDAFIGAKFSEEGDKVIAVNNRAPFWYVVFYATTGYVKKQRQHNENWFYPQMYPHSDFYYSDAVELFALHSAQSKFFLLTYYNDEYKSLQSIDYGFATSLARSVNTSYFYVGGLQINDKATLSIVDLNANLIKNYQVLTNTLSVTENAINKLVIEKDPITMKERVYGTIPMPNQHTPYRPQLIAQNMVLQLVASPLGFPRVLIIPQCNGEDPVLQTVEYIGVPNTCSLLTFSNGPNLGSLIFIDPLTDSSGFQQYDAIFFNCSQVDNYQINSIPNYDETYIINSLYSVTRQSFVQGCTDAEISYSVYINQTASTVKYCFYQYFYLECCSKFCINLQCCDQIDYFLNI